MNLFAYVDVLSNEKVFFVKVVAKNQDSSVINPGYLIFYVFHFVHFYNFSAAHWLINKLRSHLNSDNIDAITFLYKNM